MRAASLSRYPETIGISSALRTVVDVRSYSRISGLKVLEHETLSAGRVFAKVSAMLSHARGLRYEFSRQIATAVHVQPVEPLDELFDRGRS